MKKFRFPLKSLATVREARELQAREAFSAAVNAAAVAEQRLRSVRQRLTELERVMLGERSTLFRPADQSAFLYSHELEVRREREARDALAEAQAVVEQRRKDWMLSRRDLRLIEKLESKARASHQRELERELQLQLDDRTNALVSRSTA